MYSGKTLFAQVMSFLPWTTFARIVDRYDGDRSVRTLRCTEHYRAMAFAQLTGRESLRDIEACLAARSAKLYHSGFRSPVRRSTLADANECRDWRIYADFSQRLIVQARALYANELLEMELNETAYALDSTTMGNRAFRLPTRPGFPSTQSGNHSRGRRRELPSGTPAPPPAAAATAPATEAGVAAGSR